ncbi:MAG: large conductance mechanosensitive channel protein MscL [Propionibacteriaceae bacterium]
MNGFKEFLLRGNLVELAVAFIMGGVFAAVVGSFTQMFMDVLGKIGSVDTFSSFQPAGIQVGAFITALITFLITGFVVYFFVVTPYNKASSLRKNDEPAAAASTEDLLADIRDLLQAQAQGTNRPDTSGGGTTQV